MILCKEWKYSNCPKGLKICCGTCEHKGDCPNACQVDHTTCLEAEFMSAELATIETAYPDLMQQTAELLLRKKEIDETEKNLRAKLKEAMEQYGIKKIDNDVITVTYIEPTTRKGIDTTRLKKEHPELAEEYTKETPVASSIKMVVK